MTRNRLLVMSLLIASLLACAAPASAQPVSGNEWSHGTTLGVFAGTSTGSETQGTIGGALGWEINHRLELEGTGAWFIARHGDEAFAAELKVIASLTRPNTVVPFVGAGIGMYRATFDLTAGAPPDFYRRRLTPASTDALAVFTDPAYVFAAGVDIFTGDHFSFRPELSVRVVTRASDTYAVTMAIVRATYHFESHDAVR